MINAYKFGWTTLAIVISLGTIGVGCSAVPLSSNATPTGSISTNTNNTSPIASSPIFPTPSPSPKNSPKSTNSPKPIDPALIDANTQFSLNLFADLQKATPDKNLFISPSSIGLALAMTYNGADQETQAAMAKTLQIGNISIASFNAANEDLREALEYPDSEVELKIANAIWANQGVMFKPDFLRNNQKFYKAKAEALDFKNLDSLNVMNNWVKRNTSGKIEKIVDRLSGDERLFLMNATYFKGNWAQPFDKAQTKAHPFTTPAGQKTIQMMSQQGSYRYLETEDFQAVSLPYGKRRLSLYLFLPKSNQTIAQLTQSLTAKNWQTWMTEFKTQEGRVQIPRFKLDYSIDLKPTLTNLGMGIAFTPQANFSKLAEGGNMIGSVRHKTFVEVNETGTEAAAVTSIGIVATSARPIEAPFTFKADRPFLCALRDNQTGAILFMGAIVKP
jgi:serine protease inhibitor